MSGLISDEHIKTLASQSQRIDELERDCRSLLDKNQLLRDKNERLEKEVDYVNGLNSRQSVEMEHLRKRIKMYNTRLDAFFIALGCLFLYCVIAL